MPEFPGESVPTDEEAMALLQSSHSEALKVLFDRYARLVFGMARRILRDNGEAEDIVQDVFFYLYKKASLFDASKGSVKGWIAQIALHRALDRRTHLARRGFYVGTKLASLGDTLVGETDLDRQVGSKLNWSRLKTTFARLPAIQRKTLELFYFEGLDLREISARLHEPFGNTRHHFYRGLERLRKSVFAQRIRQDKRCLPTTHTLTTKGSGNCVPSPNRGI